MRIVFLGLSITSSWGNGHATTYRGLFRELAAAGHDVLFLERDVPWYAANRDLPHPPYGRTEFYGSLNDLQDRFAHDVKSADAVIVGSYVPEGTAAGDWVIATTRGVAAFYDIDTPVTLAKLARHDFEYLTPDLVRRYSLYLSFSGGPTLARLEGEFGSPRARPLYCSVDPTLYTTSDVSPTFDLGYLGTYSPDRQPTLERLLIDPAKRRPDRRFVVAGPQYPSDVEWPDNVDRVDHCPPAEHRTFYGSQRWTLNVTRADMIAAGWSPSVRLFEAAACGVPIVSDRWEGLDEFFGIGFEIVSAETADDVVRLLRDTPDADRLAIAAAARVKVLRHHTAAVRARELVDYLAEV